MYPDTTQDTCSSFIFERTGYWYDSSKKVYYSQGWRFINPLHGVNIDMTASIADQVINVTLFDFWEGSIELKGTVNNKNIEGLGFAELVAGHDFEIVCPSIPTNLTVTKNTYDYSLSWDASTAGTYPIAGYRIFRSKTNDGYWQYLTSTSDLFYTDSSSSVDSSYYYTVSSFDDQTATSASYYANATSTGINNISSSNNSIKIYPNPCKDKIFIETIETPNTSVEITNLQGQLLQGFSLQTSKCQIDVNNLSSGVYIIKVKNENSITTKKIIKLS